MRALDSIRKDTVLLRNEIIRLTSGGWTLDLSDKVFGYVFNPCSDSNRRWRSDGLRSLTATCTCS